MNDIIRKIIACPRCKGNLSIKESNMKCEKCGEEYKIVENAPVFLKKKLVKAEISVGGYRDKLRKYPFFFKIFEKVHNLLGPPNTTYTRAGNYLDKKIDSRLMEILKGNEKKMILNIGSSPRKAYKNSINLDIDLFNNVDVVADGKELPFKEKVFDIVVIEMVLEHVDEAEKVIKEVHRVLKKNGIVYISIPFVFVFHGSPNDFNRYTLNGLKRRLEISGFRAKKAGTLSGPSSTISQMLRYYLAMLFSFNSEFLFSLFLNIFGWLTFWIKYIDIFMNKHRKADTMAATIYAVGEKQ